MEVLVLDGGTGHLLKAKGIEQLVPGLAYDQLFLAGTLANIHQPELVKEVHREYVVAGADVLTTNSFACTSYSLSKIGKACQAAELISSAARLAREVADQAGRQVQVAGTLPPLQESYQTHGLPSPDDMQQQYRQIAAALLPHVDLLLCETLATVAEGLAAATVASESGKPWWISWTLEDNLSARLRSGEALETAVATISQLPGLQALLVNCCSPQAVAAALPRLQRCAPPTVRIGGYANGFATTTSQWLAGTGAAPEAGLHVVPPAEEYTREGIILPDSYARHAAHWRALGASVVGGCCGVGPQHIEAVKESLDGDD